MARRSRSATEDPPVTSASPTLIIDLDAEAESTTARGAPPAVAPAPDDLTGEASPPEEAPTAPRRRTRHLGVVGMWLRIVSALLITVFAAVWALLQVTGTLAERETALELWERALRPPTELTVVVALAEREDVRSSFIATDDDLVGAVVTPEELRDDLPGVVTRLVADRAEEIHQGGLPPDPGVAARSFTGVPRPVLAQLTQERHEQIPAASVAAGVGAGAGLLLGLAAAGIGGTLWLAGLGSLAGAGLAWVLTRTLGAVIAGATPTGRAFDQALREAAATPVELLVFVGLALSAAAVVFRWIAPR